MTTQAISLNDIREAAQNLANRNNDLTATAAIMNAEIKAAIGPVVEKYRETLDSYAAGLTAAQAKLMAMMESSPHLFVKPRSMTVDGISCGFRKANDSLDWDDDQIVIDRIAALMPERYTLLVREVRSLIVDALSGLSDDERVKIGVRTVTGVDVAYIKIGDNDVEKIAKLVVADATARQGEDEKATQKRGKAALKVAA